MMSRLLPQFISSAHQLSHRFVTCSSAALSHHPGRLLLSSATAMITSMGAGTQYLAWGVIPAHIISKYPFLTAQTNNQPLVLIA